MKKTLTTIGYYILALAFLVIGAGKVQAQTSCGITDVSWSDTPENMSESSTTATLTIETLNCSGGINVAIKGVQQFLKKSDGYKMFTPYTVTTKINGVDSNKNYIPPQDGILKINYTLDEYPCFKSNEPYDCVVFTEISQAGKVIYDNPLVNKVFSLSEIEAQNHKDGVLLINCDGECDPGIFPNNWEYESDNGLTNAECTINEGDIFFEKINGFDGVNFPSITNKNVTLKIKSTGCNSGFYVHLRSKSDKTIDISNVSNDAVFVIPDSNKTYVSIRYKAHEDECYNHENFDCSIYVKVTEGASFHSKEIINTKKYLLVNVDNREFNQSYNFIRGVIVGNCASELVSGDCDLRGNDWRLLFHDGVNGGVSTPQNILLAQSIDNQSPCFKDGEYDPTCYEPLAPFPTNGTDSIFQIDPDTGRQFIDLKNLDIGNYINEIFRVALAILMVIAVIMIVIAGVQYMTVESFYGKSDAKKRISNALVGLIVALGITIILGTINPQLLEVNFTSGIETVTASFEANQFIPGEDTRTVGKSYAKLGSISSGLASIQDDLNNGVKIKSFTVTARENTASGNAVIELKNGKKSGSFPVSLGGNGISSNWVSGNKQSPTGTYPLGLSRYEFSDDPNNAILTRGKNSRGERNNLGPAFISIDQNPYVGIGIHGKSKANNLSTTLGCVRVRNEDLVTFMENFDPGTSTITLIAQ